MKTNIALGLVIALSLSACAEPVDEMNNNSSVEQVVPTEPSNFVVLDEIENTGSNRLYGWTDPETNCQYLLWFDYDNVAMIPRLDSYNNIICNNN